jgi:competence ComEA-like helix-hairpin-helix protein
MPSDGDEKLSYPTIKIPNKELPVEILLMDFDPNTTDSLEWIKLGFKPFAVRNILKYISKGGRFKNCQDLKKIYGIDTNFVEKILPHCKIENTNGKNEAVKSSDKLSEKININLADSLALKSLYGIGPKLSKRIVKYRDNLGGFHDIMQLKEVYGITDEVIANNINTLDASGPLRKININTSDFEAMSHHYYFDYKTSRLIINYRNQHGNFDSLTHLKKIKLLPDSIFEKIKPYCSIE